MKYVVTSVWKHPNAIDWQQMRQNMSEAKDNAHIAEIHWYEIDETTHGSVAIYHSKEAYEANLAFQEENRSKSTMNAVFRCSTKRMVRAMSISQAYSLNPALTNRGVAFGWPFFGGQSCLCI